MAKDEEKQEGKEAAPAAEGEAAPKSKKKLIIIVAVAAVVVIGAAAFFMMGGKKEEGAEGKPEEHAEEHKHYEQAELQTFIVNLSETSNFLKVKLLLEYDAEILAKAGGEAGGGHGGGEGEKAAGLPGVLGTREAMIQDAVIKVLSSKKAADVLTIEGKEQIKEELLEAINEASQLEEPPIVAVYFKEFIVQ